MKYIASLLALTLSVSGCAIQRTNETFAKNDKTAAMISGKVNAARSARSSAVTIEDKPWVSLKPIATIPHDTRLPESMRCNLTFAPVQPVSHL
jgi:hypothetical protein